LAKIGSENKKGKNTQFQQIKLKLLESANLPQGQIPPLEGEGEFLLRKISANQVFFDLNSFTVR